MTSQDRPKLLTRFDEVTFEVALAFAVAVADVLRCAVVAARAACEVAFAAEAPRGDDFATPESCDGRARDFGDADVFAGELCDDDDYFRWANSTDCTQACKCMHALHTFGLMKMIIFPVTMTPCLSGHVKYVRPLTVPLLSP